MEREVIEKRREKEGFFFFWFSNGSAFVSLKNKIKFRKSDRRESERKASVVNFLTLPCL